MFAAEGEDLVDAAGAAGVEPVELLVAGENVEPALLAEVSTLPPHPPRDPAGWLTLTFVTSGAAGLRQDREGDRPDALELTGVDRLLPFRQPGVAVRRDRGLDLAVQVVTESLLVVDQDLRILVWSSRAEDLWGLRESEVAGKNFLNLDIGVSVESLGPAIRACLNGSSEIEERELDAVDRRGRSFRCHIAMKPLHGAGLPPGVIVMMDRRS